MASSTTKKKSSTQKAAVKAPDVKAYVQLLQKQVNTDIQAVKSGAMDEELLRAKIVEDMDPTSVSTQLTLWLHALAGGIIDNLSVLVSSGENGPRMDFVPEWNQRTDAKAPILELPIPGPNQVRRGAGESPVLESSEPSQEHATAQ